MRAKKPLAWIFRPLQLSSPFSLPPERMSPPRVISPCHDPFIAKDIRHRMNVNPETPAMQRNWWEKISRETCETGWMGETRERSRSEVRGCWNIEPGTSNFGARHWLEQIADQPDRLFG